MAGERSRGDVPKRGGAGPRPYNRLSGEQSPYLTEHAQNPVDWYPWGDEAFSRAEATDRPVFLSIGYSSCHWCHVMARESFEDPEVARLLNESFIAIKVDREERPDIDRVYMAACLAMTGTGGWPLSLFLTPGRSPFFAATYIPRTGRYGQAGMIELLPRIAELWNTRRDELLGPSAMIRAALDGAGEPGDGGTAPDERLFSGAYEDLVLKFDEEYGGFGNAPKFPALHTVMFLLRYRERTGSRRALAMAVKTLEGIRKGGIYDHAGGGIHRYSTDAMWRTPHFEKMLYDQAMAVMAYCEAYQATQKPCFRKTAEDIAGYVLRDMTLPSGAFCSAEDADSDGGEGAYYLWEPGELDRVLGPEDGAIARAVFNVAEPGTPAVLYRSAPLSVLAGRFALPQEELEERVRSILKSLTAARKERPRPSRDDKVLSDWNGLLIAALAKAAGAFDEPAYAEAASKAADFILSNMRTDDGGIFHRYRAGEAGIPGFADDYAMMAFGLAGLYEATFERRYLDAAAGLASYLVRHFSDTDGGGGFFTVADNAEQLLVRTKEIADGALPSPNSVAYYALLRISRLAELPGLEEAVKKIPAAFLPAIRSAPAAHAFLLCGLDFTTGNRQDVVIAGDRAGAGTRALIRACRAGFHPSLIMRLEDPAAPVPAGTASGLPAPGRYPLVDGKPTAYLCTNKRCLAPVTDPAQLRALLGIRI